MAFYEQKTCNNHVCAGLVPIPDSKSIILLCELRFKSYLDTVSTRAPNSNIHNVTRVRKKGKLILFMLVKWVENGSHLQTKHKCKDMNFNPAIIAALNWLIIPIFFKFWVEENWSYGELSHQLKEKIFSEPSTEAIWQSFGLVYTWNN